MKLVEEKKGVTYSLAEPEDLPEIIPFFLQIPKENELLALLKTDVAKTVGFLRQALEGSLSACMVAQKDGIIIGAILLRKSTVWWSSTPFFTNVAFYVLPGYRGMGVQDELLHAAKGFSETLKMPLFMDLFDNTGNNTKKVKWFKRKKFKDIGYKVVYLPEG